MSLKIVKITLEIKILNSYFIIITGAHFFKWVGMENYVKLRFSSFRFTERKTCYF